MNLIIAEDLGDVSNDEVMRVLAPLGTLLVKQGDSWKKTVKPWPKEMDEWTHYLHDPTNNAVAHDTVVGPPHHLQWIGSPVWARSYEHLGTVSAAVSAGGKLFYIVDEGPIASVHLPPQWRRGAVWWEALESSCCRWQPRRFSECVFAGGWRTAENHRGHPWCWACCEGRIAGELAAVCDVTA